MLSTFLDIRKQDGILNYVCTVYLVKQHILRTHTPCPHAEFGATLMNLCAWQATLASPVEVPTLTTFPATTGCNNDK